MEDSAMKKIEYMKPAMRMVEIQQRHIICDSPLGYDGYNGQSLGTYRNSGDEITDGEEDEIF